MSYYVSNYYKANYYASNYYGAQDAAVEAVLAGGYPSLAITAAKDDEEVMLIINAFLFMRNE